jgi:hypothetical protein
MRKLTYAPLFLLIGTLTLSLAPRKDSLLAGYAAAQQDPRVERANKAKGAFPIAEINEPEPDTNSELGRAKKEKRQRYDAWNLVTSNPAPGTEETIVSSEGYFDFPPLPVTRSDIILIASVSNSEAHLSANKRGVFSEFNLVVESVLKTSDQKINEGSLFTVDRVGGYVKYPNGQQILCRISGVNMPQTGARYLFFLSARRKPIFTILTAYELTNEGVMPLDSPEQFRPLEGISETDLLKRVRDLLTK